MTPAVDTTEAASSSSSLPMAAINDDTRRSASIASLLGPAGGRGATGSINALNANRGLSTAPSSSSRLPSQSTHVHSDRHSFRPADNNHLLSLSRLAAEMEPVSPSDPSPGLPAPPASAFNRTRSVPVNSRSVPISSSDRGGGASCSGSRDSLRLGVAGGSTKRLSRTKSAFGNMRRAVAAAASNMASTASHSSANSSENTNSHSNTTGPSNVLRTIQNPTNSGGNLSRRALGTSSKATSTTNSLDSLANSGSNGMGHHPTPGLGTTNHNNINNNNNTNSIAIPKTEATAAVMLTNLPRLHASRLRMEGGTNHSVFQAAAARLADAPRTPSMTPRSIHHINASAAMEMDVVEPRCRGKEAAHDTRREARAEPREREAFPGGAEEAVGGSAGFGCAEGARDRAAHRYAAEGDRCAAASAAPDDLTAGTYIVLSAAFIGGIWRRWYGNGGDGGVIGTGSRGRNGGEYNTYHEAGQFGDGGTGSICEAGDIAGSIHHQ